MTRECTCVSTCHKKAGSVLGPGWHCRVEAERRQQQQQTVGQSRDLLGETPVTLAAQLDVANRELRKRLEVYPRLIAKGRMTGTKADSEIRGMRAIIATIERVIRSEAKAGP